MSDAAFFNSDAVCPVCAFDSVGTRYVAAGSAVVFDYEAQKASSFSHMRVEAAFLERRCRRCGYRWQELPTQPKPARKRKVKA